MTSRSGKKKPKERPTIVVWTCLLRKTHARYMREAEKTGRKLSHVLREKLEPHEDQAS